MILALFLQGILAAGNNQSTSALAAPASCSSVSTGIGGSLNGYIPSPKDAWHQDVTNWAVDSNSANIIAVIGATHMHADFGSGSGGGGVPFGIPYEVVNGGTLVNVPPQLYTTDSDIVPAPIPSDLPIEGAPPDCTSPAG